MKASPHAPARSLTIGVFLVVLVSGGLLRLGSMRPGNLLPELAHDRLFSLHAAAVLGALPLFLAHLASTAKEDQRWRTAAVMLLIVGVTLGGFALRQGDWIWYGGLGAMLAGTGMLAWATVRPVVPLASRIVLLVAFGGFALACVGALTRHSAVFGMAMLPIVVAVLVLPMLTLRSRGKKTGGAGFLAAIAVYCTSWALARFWVGGALFALPELIAGAIVGVAVFRSARDEDTRWAAWVRRLEASFFVEALLLVVVMQIAVGPLPLQDTLFAVAAVHLHAFVLVFALLRRFERASRSAAGWTGLTVSALGAHAFAWACVVLGSRGMARRYTEYLDTFEHLQVTASVGAFMLLAGLLAVVVAQATPRRD